MDSKKSYELEITVLVSTISLLFSAILIQLLLIFTNLPNIVVYIVCVISALVIMLILSIFLMHCSYPLTIIEKQLSRHFSRTTATAITIALVTVWTILWINTYDTTCRMPDGPINTYSWQKLGKLQFYLILGGILLVFFILERHFRILEISRPYRVLEWTEIIFLLFFSFFTNYWSSYLNCWYTIYHSDAYFNNVYNAYYGAPYSNLNYGTYGHYGILQSIVLHVIGLNHFNVLMALLSALFVAFGFYCIKKLVHNQNIRMMAYLAMVVVNARNFIDMASLQGTPHRQFFPLLMCALCIWGIMHEKERNKYFRTTVFIITVLSIQWNIESGMACAFGGAFLQCINVLADKCTLLKKIRSILFHIAAVIGEFLVAWGLTSLWNVSVGGYWLPLREFLVPLTSIDNQSSFVTGLELPLQVGNSLWLWVLMMYLFFIVVVLVRSLLGEKSKLRKDHIAAGTIATIGIIHLTFFVNRAGWGGLFVAVYTGFILFSILVQWVVDWCIACKSTKVEYILAHTGKIMLASLLFLFAVSTPVLAAQYMPHKIESLSLQMAAEQQLLNEIKENVPENTAATGSGAAYIYARLGWENPLKLCDTPAEGSSTAAMQLHSDIICNSQEPILLILNGTRLDLWNEISDRYHVQYKADMYGMPIIYAIPKEAS